MSKKVYLLLQGENRLKEVQFQRIITSSTKTTELYTAVYTKLGAKQGTVVVLDDCDPKYHIPLAEFIDSLLGWINGGADPDVGQYNENAGKWYAQASVSGDIDDGTDMSPGAALIAPSTADSKSGKPILKRQQLYWYKQVTVVLKVAWPRVEDALGRLVAVSVPSESLGAT